jgi:flagella basal body P-ring formation protein FlgA
MILSALSSTYVFAAFVTQEKLTASIEKQVVSKLSKTVSGEIQAKALMLPVASLEIPQGKLEIKVDLDNNKFVPKKYTMVTLNVDGQKVRKFPVPVTLTLEQNVWVANDNISKDNTLNSASFNLEKKDITNNYALIIGADKDLSDYVAIRAIKPGEVLDRRCAMLKPDVFKNSIVSAIFDAGGINIAMEATALQNGVIGDSIRVHSEKYKKFYTGEIIGQNKVLVKI